jgi:FdhD protein
MEVVNLTQRSPIKRITDCHIEHLEDTLAVEEPLAIRIRYGAAGSETEKDISVTMRTPGNDAELALGFLFTEGVIRTMEQVAAVRERVDDNRVLVVLGGNEVPDLSAGDRNFYTTSSCGVCGKASVEAIRTLPASMRVSSRIMVKAALFSGLEDILRREQAAFGVTGGLHASALFDPQGELMMLREDVGRHNALDKVIGASLQAGALPLSNAILLLSGRVSFELIQKACMAGIGVIAAVGAPSSLAVALAQQHDVTLIGFVRKTRFNIYSGAQRIIVSP